MMDERLLSENANWAFCQQLLQSAHAATCHSDRILSRWGLTQPRFSVLQTLHIADGPMRLSDISNTLRVSGANVTLLVNRLEADGLVTRERSAEDGRAVLVGITAAGGRLVQEAHAALAQAFSDLLEFVEGDERRALARFLTELCLRIDEAHSEAACAAPLPCNHDSRSADQGDAATPSPQCRQGSNHPVEVTPDAP